LFLGVPFNITSYCLLLSVIAKITNLTAHEFVHTYGDLHIYENHVEQLQDQIEREPMDLPQLWINPELNSIDDFVRSDVKLIGYNHRGVLRGEVAV
jgi:thymidylate synthase